jgi:small-conductance mechanosensitive channel
LATGYKEKYNQITKESETVEYQYWAKNDLAREKDKENGALNDEKQQLLKEKTRYETKKDSIEKILSIQATSITTLYNLQRATVTQIIENLTATYPTRKENYTSTVKLNPDILERMQYLSNISSWFNPVWWASFVIGLLFMLLETAPSSCKTSYQKRTLR